MVPFNWRLGVRLQLRVVAIREATCDGCGLSHPSKANARICKQHAGLLVSRTFPG